MKPVLTGLAASAWLLCLGLFPSPANAATVVVVDAASGQPLADAIVEIVPVDAESRAPREAEVIQRDAAFHPNVTHVPIDSAVSFPNRDTTRHHVYSFSTAKTFDLKLYLQETPPPVIFDTAGVVVLGCNIHDHMQAFIVVSNALHTATTQEDGTANFPTLSDGEHRLRIWHPRLDDSHQRWWEGNVGAGQQLTVPLTLEATPPPTPSLSPLQQRFRYATRQP